MNSTHAPIVSLFPENILGTLHNRRVPRAAGVLPALAAILWALMPLCAQGDTLVWDENLDSDGGDGTSWTSSLNWHIATTPATDAAPASGDNLFIGASQTFQTVAQPTGSNTVSPILNLGGNQSVGALHIGSVHFDDRNITSLLAHNVDVSFNNGGNDWTLTTASLDMAFGQRISGVNFGRLTLGNLGADPNQTLHVTGTGTNATTVGSLRNADAQLIVEDGGTLMLGTSTSSRNGVTIGWQRSGNNSISKGLIQTNGGTFIGYINDLRIGRNESTTQGTLANMGDGTLDLTGIVLGENGNVLDVNTGYFANETSNGDAQKATINLGEGTARFGAMTLGRAAAALGASLTEATVNLDGTIVVVDGSGVTINGTSSINVFVDGDYAGLDLAAGVPLTINDSGELNITFGAPSVPGGELVWGLRALGNRVSEFESLAGLNLYSLTTNEPSIFFVDGFTYVGFYAATPEPSTCLMLVVGTIGLCCASRRNRKLRNR